MLANRAPEHVALRAIHTIWRSAARGALQELPDGRRARRGLARNTEERRCLCNGLLACVGLRQIKEHDGQHAEEPAIITLGDRLDGIRRLSRDGQVHYWAADVVSDLPGPPPEHR